VWRRYAQIEEAYGDNPKAANQHITEFFGDLQEAYTALSGSPEYRTRRCGEAYTLRWHPQRTDNLLKVLPVIAKKADLPQLNIVDVGAGTGCCHTAASILLSDGRIDSADIRFVEYLPSMRIMTRNICREVSKSKALDHLPTYGFSEATSLQELVMCADSVADRNLLLFHHTFPELSPTILDRVTRQIRLVASQLPVGGAVAFLSPTSYLTKVAQCKAIVSALIDDGFEDLWSHSCKERTSSRYVNEARPSESIAVVSRLAREAGRRSLIPPVDVADRDSLPWYGSYYTIQVVRRP
jgi:hypothetical protein